MDGRAGRSEAKKRRHGRQRPASRSEMHRTLHREAPMTILRTPLFLGLALALALPLLGACHRDAPPAGHPAADAQGAPQTALGKSVDVALRKARAELETSDLDISNGP